MTQSQWRPIRRALVSVSDKSGVVDLAAALIAHGVEILATGNTHRMLTEAGIAAREVAQYTGFPELLDGRLKTLHPKIHGGILARRGADDAALAQHGIHVDAMPQRSWFMKPLTAELAALLGRPQK